MRPVEPAGTAGMQHAGSPCRAASQRSTISELVGPGEPVTYVRTRVGTTMVAIFGHSWGCPLGVLAEASQLNLLKRAPALQMPVFFFLGRRDHWVPPETSGAAPPVISRSTRCQ